MKKLVLVLALTAVVMVSCNKVTPSSKLTTVDSTTVDSVKVDDSLHVNASEIPSTTVDSVSVK